MSPDPFITAQDLTDYLGRDVTADNGAIIALDAACDMCRTIGEQSFNRGTTTYTLDGTGTDAILLPDLPVNSAGTVLVDGTAVTDYMLAGNGVLLRGTATSASYWGWRPVWPTGRQNVVVTADHGYDVLDVPRDVRMVALSIASRLVVQGVAIEESLGANRIRYGTNATDLTNGERLILEKYRPTR